VVSQNHRYSSSTLFIDFPAAERFAHSPRLCIEMYLDDRA
jgi:hypothetical protein